MVFCIIGLALFYLGRKADGIRPETVLATIKDSCFSDALQKNHMICLEKSLRPHITTESISSYLHALEVQFRKEDDASAGGITKCHETVHVIGILAGERSENISKTFGECTPICGYGCYMGVTDGYLAHGRDYLKEVESICSNTAHSLPCWHAVGHTFVNRVGNIDDALALCERISDVMSRSHCISGVFMETYEFSGYGHEQKPIPSDMIAYCETVRSEAQTYCFTVAGYFTYRSSGDKRESIRVCNSVPEDRRNDCFHMLGKNVYYDVNGSEEIMHAFCGMVSEHYRSECTRGVIFASVTSDPLARHSVSYCSLLSGISRITCFSFLGEEIERNAGEEARKEICKGLDSDDASSCIDQTLNVQ